jgi:hypothetical protein
MEVIAIRRGYHGKLREPGEKFDVPVGTEGSWFEPTSKVEVVEKPARGAAKKSEPAPPVVEKPADDLV